MSKKKTVAILGCGNLGGIIAKGIVGRLGDAWDLVGVFDRTEERAQQLGAQCGCESFSVLEDLLARKPEIVVEATVPAFVREVAGKILAAGCDLMPLSIGAFADEAFCAEIENIAREKNQRVYFVCGAIGGLDVMQSALMSGELHARIVNVKSPEALSGAPWLEAHPAPADREETIFSGNAKAAIEAFPKNVNVAVALALATVGVEKTEVEVRSVPGKALNTHTVHLNGDFGRAVIEIESVPSPENPRSSMIAAMSVLAKLKNMAAPLSFI